MASDESNEAGFWQALWQGPMALYRIRFGKGVLGRLTTNLIAILSVFGSVTAVALFLGYVRIGIGCLVVCGLAYLINHLSTMMFAYRHPGPALLEGADFVRLREIEMAGKDLPSRPAQPNIEAPVIEAIAIDADAIQPERKVGKIPDQHSSSGERAE